MHVNNQNDTNMDENRELKLSMRGRVKRRVRNPKIHGNSRGSFQMQNLL